MGERVKVEVGQRRINPRTGCAVRVVATEGTPGHWDERAVVVSPANRRSRPRISTVERWPVIPAVGTEGEG